MSGGPAPGGPGEGGWIDITRPLDPGRLVVWPGDPPLETALIARLDPDPRAASPANVTAARLSLHAGTHIDAPRHFLPEGKAIEEVPIERCIGPARLVRHSPDRHLAAADLESLLPAGTPAPPRLLIATANAARARSDRFREDYVALLPEAARWIVERRILLVGIDYLSIGPPDARGEEVHRLLLGAEVAVLEGLVLEGLAEGDYDLAALPLAVRGSDGGPVRAAVRRRAGRRGRGGGWR